MDVIILKIFIPAVLAFFIGIAITPVITHFLYKHKIWKKTGGKIALNGQEATEFNRLKGQNETKTPRMGGIVVWSSILITVLLLYIFQHIFSESLLSDLNFLSRSQTWIPLATLAIGALIGFIGDVYDVTQPEKSLRISTRLILITILSGAIGWWFYDRLEVIAVNFPNAPLELGILIIPFFITVSIFVYAGGVIDGIDGLSAGVFATIFTSYGAIAFMLSQYELAAFCATVTGAILAFLWFNIPPARFYMTETGTMALTLTLAVVAFMTDTLGGGYGFLLLPIITAPLVATVASNIIQVTYRKITGEKFFKIAPLHHHFEAIGWPSHKVTMRYWVISMICGLLGIIATALLIL